MFCCGRLGFVSRKFGLLWFWVEKVCCNFDSHIINYGHHWLRMLLLRLYHCWMALEVDNGVDFFYTRVWPVTYLIWMLWFMFFKTFCCCKSNQHFSHVLHYTKIKWVIAFSVCSYMNGIFWSWKICIGSAKIIIV